MFLRFYSKERLWKELLFREGFSDRVDLIEGTAIWHDVFHRVPILQKWLKKRENILLASIALSDKKSEFVLGQLAENRFYSKFDVPGISERKVEDNQPVKEINKDVFISNWNKKDAASEHEV